MFFYLEKIMYVPKGYRAREAAARLRNNRKLVSDEVRAARSQALPDKVEAKEYHVESEITTSVQTAAEIADREAAEKLAAQEVADKEAAELAEKEAAELAEKENGEEANDKQVDDDSGGDADKAKSKKSNKNKAR